MFYRQAVVYAEEFGYSPVFERYVSHGLAPFLDDFDAGKDRIWMASRGAERLGFIAIQHDPTRRGWAKLRWFLVEKEARGLGVGRRLMQAALAFARKAGYRGVYLWTVDDLAAARRVYVTSGFVLVHEATEPCEWAPWGHEQRWELELARRPRRARSPAKH